MTTSAQLRRAERNLEIVAKARAGAAYVDLSTEYGMTLQRVWQICRAAGVKLSAGKQRRSKGAVRPIQVPQPKRGRKTCTQCGVDKPFADFSKSSRESDGLQDNCKACNREISAAYRAANVEKERKRHAAYQSANKPAQARRSDIWRKRHPEQVKEITRRHYIANREKELARHAAYAAANAERIRIKRAQTRLMNIEQRKAYEREYTRKNRAKINAKTVRRKARLMQALVVWANHEKIANFYAEAQRLSKETGIKHHVDHIVPLQSKVVCGLHCEHNLQILTGSENLKKRNKHEDRWEIFQIPENLQIAYGRLTSTPAVALVKSSK